MPLLKAGLLALLLLTRPAAAAEWVDVELVFAADGSGSIDPEEFALQRAGYAAAIQHPDVIAAIRAGARGAIAVAYLEWAAAESVATIVGWHVIRNAADAKAFADRLVAAARVTYGYNSISSAIDHAVGLLTTNDLEGDRQVIDVSGDGPQYGGRPLQLARAEALALGLTINALAINPPGSGGYSGPRGEPLIEHYRNDVIGGPGAFAMTVDGRDRMAEALRRKLLLEIALR
jgi:hypothetical protein